MFEPILFETHYKRARHHIHDNHIQYSSRANQETQEKRTSQEFVETQVMVTR